MKRQLHTLYVKHDTHFKTLSKIALAQIVLKIVHLKGDGTLMKQIIAELKNIIIGTVPQQDVDAAIELLKKEEKIHVKAGRHFIHPKFSNEIRKSEESTEQLHEFVLKKYFSKGESKPEAIRAWFQDTTIKFFENFSFEWFFQKTFKGRNSPNSVPKIERIVEEELVKAKGIEADDQVWLKDQYIKFIESDGANENLLFWQYGISMFSSRLITARHYADELSIEMFKDSTFILDTNILMILDLEAHELNSSFCSLEAIFKELNIKPGYFAITRAEYLRAMSWRRDETIKIFNNYNLPVLRASDCPFIMTALKRGCTTDEDVKRMFDILLDIPTKFHKDVDLIRYEYAELDEAISAGQQNEPLKDAINEVYKKRVNKDKRENPLLHDTGLVAGITFLRKSEKCWIITSDSTLKLYALNNTVRDEHEIAVGLDVILGILAVNSGGVQVDASNFAPLFKNLVRYSLLPVSETYELEDLAFILNTNTKVNELTNEKVIEVAKQVKQMRVAGESDETVSLYLRRVIEGEKIALVQDINESKSRESIVKSQLEKAESENLIFAENYKNRRRGELRDKYDDELRNNRFKLLIIPIVVGILVFLTIKYFLTDSRPVVPYLIGISVELIFGILPLIPLNARLKRKYSEYVVGIDEQIENEIRELKHQAK